MGKINCYMLEEGYAVLDIATNDNRQFRVVVDVEERAVCEARE
jgi:hypothetical protein